MRTLTLVTTGFRRPDPSELRRMELADEYPRTLLYEEMLNCDILDERFLNQVPAYRKLLYGPLPVLCRQILEAYVQRKRYDAIISWSERHGLLFALLLKLTFTRVPHVALFSWISKPKKGLLLRFVHSHIDRIVLWSTYQRDVAVNRLRIPPSKILLSRWFVDNCFFRPMAVETDMICAVGFEMRDYPTLIEALRELDIRCHIAVGTGREVRGQGQITAGKPLPSGVTVGKKNYQELRDLYARSRLVVVPILPASDTDNGVTAILEAMAMGKPVICSRVKAQTDVVQDGVNGLYVPPGDPKALRDAILYLWENPEKAAELGKRGRSCVEANHTPERFYEGVKKAVEEAMILREKRKR